jgi:phage-related baseplate assembly protein
MPLFQTDLDIDALLTRIETRWQELSGQPLTPGSLEWGYARVLVLVASWSKIDVEKAIDLAYKMYVQEINLLPFGAGNKEAIIALAKAFTDVADINVADSTTPMVIQVFLLAKTGTPTSTQINNLQNYLNSPKVKNLCDTYTVAAASQLLWNFNANIAVSGDPIALRTRAIAAINAYALEKQKLGATIRTTDFTKALRAIAGIEDVSIVSPVANISTAANQFPKLGTLTISTTII